MKDRDSALRRASRWVLGGLLLASLGGCRGIEIRTGARVDLTRTPVVSLQAAMPDNAGLAPGQKSPLVVTLAQPDGTVLTTEGRGQGKVLWSDLAVSADVVSVNRKGIVTLPADPRVSDGKAGHIAITVPSHPGLQAELTVPVRYDGNFAANFCGAPGSDGMNGFDGTNGTDGSPGSTDPNNPSPGGNGSNGSDGSNGGDGGNGGDAPPVQVRVTLRAGDRPLLMASVSAPGHAEQFFLVDPHGGSLIVEANGGLGGSGGKGGRGGRGGSGGIGTPNGTSGSNGSDGRNGFDGPAGRAGSITVTYDPHAQPFLTAIHLSNPGGPKPVWIEKPVAPLW